MLHLLGVSPSGAVAESAEFDRLWIASLIATVLPMLTIFAIPWLIPDAKQTDSLLDENAPNSATAGSLMEKWLGYEQDPITEAEFENQSFFDFSSTLKRDKIYDFLYSNIEYVSKFVTILIAHQVDSAPGRTR